MDRFAENEWIRTIMGEKDLLAEVLSELEALLSI